MWTGSGHCPGLTWWPRVCQLVWRKAGFSLRAISQQALAPDQALSYWPLPAGQRSCTSNWWLVTDCASCDTSCTQLGTSWALSWSQWSDSESLHTSTKACLVLVFSWQASFAVPDFLTASEQAWFRFPRWPCLLFGSVRMIEWDSNPFSPCPSFTSSFLDSMEMMWAWLESLLCSGWCRSLLGSWACSCTIDPYQCYP